MSFDTTASRFLRPSDVARLRRNQRRIQAGRLLIILRNVGLVATIAGVAFWAWRHTQSDARFAVGTIEVEGLVHTPRASVDAITSQYSGLNLFQIDLQRVERDLGGLAWVRKIDIEKKLPDTLRIRITERSPIALSRIGDSIRYVDEEGVPFADLSPAVGDDDLPIVSDAAGDELKRTVALLRTLRASDRELYQRVSEIWPIAPRGFAFYDRQLGAVVYANADDLSAKYRNLHAVLVADHNPRIAYADLRFADRLIVKPLETSNVQN